MNADKLREEAQEIQDFLEVTMSDDPQEVIERGNDLQVYMARTGKMLADAKYMLNKQKHQDTMNIVREFIIDQKLSAKVQNAMIDGICKEWQYLVDWIERLNAACTHQLDWCRSVNSKNKEELRLSNIGKEFK